MLVRFEVLGSNLRVIKLYVFLKLRELNLQILQHLIQILSLYYHFTADKTSENEFYSMIKGNSYLNFKIMSKCFNLIYLNALYTKTMESNIFSIYYSSLWRNIGVNMITYMTRIILDWIYFSPYRECKYDFQETMPFDVSDP